MSEIVTYPSLQAKLQAALQAREQEVENYQINITNYEMAIEDIESLGSQDQDSLAAFHDQLVNLLAAERLEQSKAQIMLNVLRKQVEGSAQPASSLA